MFCSSCGSAVPDNAYVCPSCSARLRAFKFCKYCGERIDPECVVCPKCGKQIEELKQQRADTPPIIINNANNNVNTNTNMNGGYWGRPRDKWVAFFLCLFLGFFGVHKFYEGRYHAGILYLCTLGLCGFGWLFDLIAILLKPNPYYVY